MSASHLFAYHPRGDLLALADGPELLVYNGEDESPRWRHAGSGGLIALGITEDRIVSLTQEGKLTSWPLDGAAPLTELDLGDDPRALAVAADGTAAVALAGEVAVAAPDGARRALPIAGVTALAWSGDGARLAVGGDDGRLRIAPTAAGDGAAPAAESPELGAPIRSVAWNPAGFWIATAGEQVFRVDADGGAATRLTGAAGMEPDAVACSPDGALVGLRLDARTVAVLALPSKDTVASLQYLDREVVGLGFGPAPWLGVALDRGDGNKINLRTQAVHRTDPHPGRERTRWLISASIDPAALPAGRPARAPASAPAEADAGASPSRLPILIGVVLAIIAVVILLSR